MFWDRDRLLLALSTKKLQLSSRPQSHAGLLYKAYSAYYDLDLVAESLVEEQYVRVVPSTDFDLVVQTFEPLKTSASSASEPKQALLLHGYFDHIGLYNHLIRFLLEHGIRVVAFDLPGHGLSSGDRAAIDCFSQYQAAIKSVCNNELKPNVHTLLIGQSTGGAIIADALTSEFKHEMDERFGSWRAALLAPLLKPMSWTKALVMHTLLEGKRSYWPRTFMVNSHDEEFLNFIRYEDKLQHHGLSVEWVGALRKWIPRMLARTPVEGSERVTIIQGTDDTTVDWRYNIAQYRKLFPLGSALTVDGAGHHLVGESEAYRAKVFDALKRGLSLGS